MTAAWGLIFVTFLLVVAGCGLYVAGHAGWGQLCFVLGSGTAGASIGWMVEQRR